MGGGREEGATKSTADMAGSDGRVEGRVRIVVRPPTKEGKGAEGEGGGEQEQAGGMAAPPKAWKAEYAKSGWASCKSCRSPITKDQLRLGKMVQATQFDGFMPM